MGADITVPYQEAVTLREALTKAGTPNVVNHTGRQARGLHAGGRTKIYAPIRAFLAKKGLGPK
jgi:hypothetical protein